VSLNVIYAISYCLWVKNNNFIADILPALMSTQSSFRDSILFSLYRRA
jgi:hypothetical protein